jgi:ribosomal protein L7/L12
MSDDALLLRLIELEQKVEFLLAELGLTGKFHGVSPSADADVISLAQQGQKIQAIALYRRKHNVGLAEAKTAVEAMGAPPAS